MTKIEIIPVDKFLTDNYLEYGSYINLHRVIPGLDGLKPVHRRSLLGIKNVASTSLITTMTAVGEIIGKFHPFGDASIIDTVSSMARIGAINSEGDFGIKLLEDIDAAAPRYNKVGLNQKQLDYYFKLFDYTKLIDGEERKEPEFLIIPVPYCLIFGAFNWGLGVSARTPGFTYQSILEAYYTNNPRALVPSYGYSLDKLNSDLQGLWDNGVGKLKLSYKISRPDDNDILIIGSGELFKPSLNMLEKLIENNLISLKNESSDKIILKISKIPRSRIDIKDIFSKVKLACSKIRVYEIKVVYNNRIITLGMKEWLDISFGNYKANYEKYKIDRISKLEESISIILNAEQFGKLIIDGITKDDIMKSLKITSDIYDKLHNKTIKFIKESSNNSFKEEQVNKLQSLINEIKKEDIDEIIRLSDPT